jgi:hypothetical protein
MIAIVIVQAYAAFQFQSQFHQEIYQQSDESNSSCPALQRLTIPSTASDSKIIRT